jgi:hypothetical protein
MKVAMSVLAFLAIFGGVVAIPKVTKTLDHFLEPTFENSTIKVEHSDSLLYIGLALGTVVALPASRWPIGSGCSSPAARRATRSARTAAPPVPRRWFFNEIIDIAIVRPFAFFGRFAQQTFERLFVNNTLIGGPTGSCAPGRPRSRRAVRVPALLRRAAAGRRRRHGPLLPPAVMTIHLSIPLWLPRRGRRHRPRAPGRLAALRRAGGGRARAGLRGDDDLRLPAGSGGELQYVTDRAGSPSWHPLQARRRRADLFPSCSPPRCFTACVLWAALRARASARASLVST